MRVSLISINNYIFRINYFGRKSNLNESVDGLSENKLIDRLHRKFKKEPLKLCSFVKRISKLVDFQELRIFLIENNVRYSSSEILDL